MVKNAQKHRLTVIEKPHFNAKTLLGEMRL